VEKKKIVIKKKAPLLNVRFKGFSAEGKSTRSPSRTSRALSRASRQSDELLRESVARGFESPAVGSPERGRRISVHEKEQNSSIMKDSVPSEAERP